MIQFHLGIPSSYIIRTWIQVRLPLPAIFKVTNLSFGISFLVDELASEERAQFILQSLQLVLITRLETLGQLVRASG